ncbi:MAG: hypothetical protein LBV63_00825 [Candidatus Methanoplasma sp.]|jgi:hypothetical protein|nr:hypothetical protein [Candidatus Methanoplasma sp.]
MMGETANGRDQKLLIVAGIIGAAVGIAALFFTWLRVYSFSGIEEFNAIGLAIDFDGNLGNVIGKYIPLIIGVLSLVTVPFHWFAYRGGKATPILILGIVIWILAFYYQTMVFGIHGTITSDPDYLYYGVGSMSPVVCFGGFIHILVWIQWVKSRKTT